MIDDRREWLEADGRGGFASGTVSGVRTRRYHALLLTATTPPTGRVALVHGFDAWLDTPTGSHALTTQRYAPDVLHPDGARHLEAFESDPWPRWRFTLPDGTRLTHEVLVEHGTGRTVLTWSLPPGSPLVRLRVRPFLSGRDYHATHHENGAFRFEPAGAGAALSFHPYPGVPAVLSLANGTYRHAPDWYRRFLYTAEQERGLDDTEDLASPGELSWDLSGEGSPAVWVLEAGVDDDATPAPRAAGEVEELAARIHAGERARRQAFPTRLERSADAYLVRRGTGRTVMAGYPWFTDWGRDTFLALRGLCLATGRLAEARDILVEWAGAVSQGMLPNRFPDRGEAPEFNAVDASLWYVVAVHELLQREKAGSEALRAAVLAIVEGYAAGTRFGIRMDADGLLAAGEPGVQLTWMDARVGDRVITPRVGKPVEVQALWFNALLAASRWDPVWAERAEGARTSFLERFWIEERGHLADVVDVDHQPETRDETLRPNQILAVGGLPWPLVEGERARRVVDALEMQLVTPLGLRTLAPGAPGYAHRYEGGPGERDAVYHQGTVWPWLIGPFVDAWVRVRGNTPTARSEARRRFLPPLLAHLDDAGLGHVSEIADAEAPFTPRGCPFQAWSMGELLRLERSVLAEEAPGKTAAVKAARGAP